MAKRKKAEPVVTRDIPYVRCYTEAGMIETVPNTYTHCYEIRLPKRQKEITYSAKKVRNCMKEIFL